MLVGVTPVSGRENETAHRRALKPSSLRLHPPLPPIPLKRQPHPLGGRIRWSPPPERSATCRERPPRAQLGADGEARLVGASPRDGFETLIIAAIFAGLFLAGLSRELRRPRPSA